ncbi:MAG: hypothetical protein SGI88_14765 [Candidatus Hydrogenedentes bacterium]|nr:hypothetical protein [Candidatus Hydrogenedentota bacterium]
MLIRLIKTISTCACAAIVFALPFACTPARPAAPPSSVAPPDSLTILYTCDTRGHISPCNCSAGVAGGIARRKTFVDQSRSGDTLIVDAGNITAGGRPWELLELDYILRGYEAIGYHAVNIGQREAGLPEATLVETVRKHPFFVSANVLGANGAPVTPAYRLVTLKSGYRAAVLGIVDDTLLPDEIGAGLTITAPEEAIAKALPKASAESDFIVLLAFADETAMNALAERFFEIDVIVGGDVEQPAGDAVTTNKSSIVYVTDKGKSVGKLDLRYIGGTFVAENNTVTTLLENIADDPIIAALVSEFQTKQVDNNYPTEKDDDDGLTTIAPAK